MDCLKQVTGCGLPRGVQPTVNSHDQPVPFGGGGCGHVCVSFGRLPASGRRQTCQLHKLSSTQAHEDITLFHRAVIVPLSSSTSTAHIKGADVKKNTRLLRLCGKNSAGVRSATPWIDNEVFPLDREKMITSVVLPFRTKTIQSFVFRGDKPYTDSLYKTGSLSHSLHATLRSSSEAC